MSKALSALKYASAVFAAPLVLPVAGAASAVRKTMSGNIVGGLLTGASTYVLAVAANHWIANPNANLADSLHLARHPDVVQITSDLPKATGKWMTGAFTAATVATKVAGAAFGGLAHGVDQTIERNRSGTEPRFVP